MILSFDKFERYELPQVTLCNPNSRATEVDGKITITDTVGVLSNPKGMNLKLNFNAPHELSFDYYRHKSSDPIKQSFYDKIYEAIQTDRYIYLTDIGYFTIKNSTDSDEDNIDKKSISLKSCEENELASAEGLHLKEGTYYLCTEDNQGLLDLFFPKTAGWTIGFIDPSLLTKPYFVEETEVDNGYNFLYTTIQDMFECIVEPDIIRRTISFYSRVYYAEHHLTDIHIAKYNLLKHKIVEENDEDKYTALNVQGKDENLEIRAVNPTGRNVIYNFEPRYSWMSSALQTAVVKWQEKCESVEEEYLALQQGYYNDMQNIVFPLEEDIKVLELQLKEKEQTRDTIVYGDYDKEEYDEIQDNALKEVNAEIQNISTQIFDKKTQLETEKNNIEVNYSQPLSQINKDCALDLTAKDIDGNAIFTTHLLNELMTHIKPTEYVDEYMLVTESMTYPQRFEKAKELMDRAQSQLVKISSGQKTYSIDTRSFLFNKQFKHFSEQLCAGAIIYVETKRDKMEQLHLTGIDISFDEKSTNFTLGNKYDRSDLKALYEDALGQNSKSFSELKYIASIIEDQQKQLDYQRNWVADLRTLTLDNVLTSEDQAIEINNRGLIGRKRQLNEDGSWKTDENGNPLFELEQVKLINNTLVFTKDNWQTASTAVGKIAVGYDDKGNVKYSYGINGQVLIGELILGNNLVLTGTGAGIKITDSNGNNVFYADENGNLVLSGTIYANAGKIGGWTIMDNWIQNAHIHAPPSLLADGTLDTSHNGIALGGSGDYPSIIVRKWHGTTIYDYTDTLHINGKTGNISITGSINASSGKIGDWTIGSVNGTDLSVGLYSSGTYGVGMFSNGAADHPAIWAGYTGATSTPYTFGGDWTTCTNFFVTNDGYMKANNANITGTINAAKGVIGGWTIDTNSLKNGILGTSGSAFVCTGTTSNVTLGGHTGTGWVFGAGTNFGVTNTGILYASGANISGTLNAGGWTIGSGNIISNKYGNVDNNFIALMAPNKIASSGVGSDVFVVRIGGTDNFRVNSDGSLLATRATITGTINANKGNIAGWMISSELTSPEAQHPWAPDGYLGQTRLTVDSVGTRVRSPNGTYSSWDSAYWSTIVNRANVSTIEDSSDSDIRLKKDIETYSDKYDLFFDLLNPVRYKYVTGTSNRYHTGFIAQEVVDSLANSNLTMQDFAAVMLYNEGQEAEKWRLRRDEFVALNTWQIQKAKARITELENTVAELKTQIQTLTAG